MLEVVSALKQYGSNTALDRVSFSVAPGEVLAVIGPNGAGKSTLFRVLAGVELLDSGTCFFAEQSLNSLSASSVGFLPELPFYYKNFQAVEMLQFEVSMRNISLEPNEIEQLMATFSIGDFEKTKMKNLSQGMAKRVSLACAFLGKPSIIILDEPLNGLDIQTVLALKRQIRTAQSKGSCILISSHVLNFFDGLINRALFLKEGQIAYESTSINESSENIYRELFGIED